MNEGGFAPDCIMAEPCLQAGSCVMQPAAGASCLLLCVLLGKARHKRSMRMCILESLAT